MLTYVLPVLFGLGLLYLVLSWLGPSGPRTEPNTPPILRGPHRTILMSDSDQGKYVLIRSTLYEPRCNDVLITQVIFDKWGHVSLTRFARADPSSIKYIAVGTHRTTELLVPFGVGAGTLRFANDRHTSWTS